MGLLEEEEGGGRGGGEGGVNQNYEKQNGNKYLSINN